MASNNIKEEKNGESSNTPNEDCAICLSEITHQCHPNSCPHKFCFECLKEWSTEKMTCPLCIKSFNKIHYTAVDTGTPETYFPVILNTSHLPTYLITADHNGIHITEVRCIVDVLCCLCSRLQLDTNINVNSSIYTESKISSDGKITMN